MALNGSSILLLFNATHLFGDLESPTNKAGGPTNVTKVADGPRNTTWADTWVDDVTFVADGFVPENPTEAGSSTIYPSTTFSDKIECYENGECLTGALVINIAWYINIIINIVGVWIFAPLGFVSACLSTWIWTSKEMLTPSALFMVTLDIYSFIEIIVMWFFSYGADSLAYYFPESDALFWYYENVRTPAIPLKTGFLPLLAVAKAYTTVALTVDRVIGVWLPLRHPTVCTKRRIQVTILLCHAFAWITAGPLFGLFKAVWIYFPHKKRSTWYPLPTPFFRSDFYSQIYVKIIVPVVYSLIPIALIVINNAAILLGVVQMAAKAKKMSGGGQTKSKDKGKDGEGKGKGKGKGKRDSAVSKITAQVVVISTNILITRVIMFMNFYITIVKYRVSMINKIPNLHWPLFLASGIAFDMLTPFIQFVCFCLIGNKFRNTLFKKVGIEQLLAWWRERRAAKKEAED